MWQRAPVKAGTRSDLGITVRSGWEANIARWLKYQGIEWEYEPKRFYFPIKRGTKSYCPDFWLPEKEQWLEVKGHIPQQDKTRMRRFKLHCPTEFKRLTVIVGTPNTEAAKFFQELDVPVLAYYSEIHKKYKDEIPYWGT